MATQSMSTPVKAHSPVLEGEYRFHRGRSRRVVKVKQRGSYWLVWLA
ncbi:hypothetical protein WDJ50_18610 (plasmid) [Deinococcus sp. VB142]|uniref:Transposase n=1 Tax=Deinococcus sp. VB142 TaxID=3112952 RepID=A0AAU6Q8M2_9DEIO